MRKKTKLIQGFGKNDADYQICAYTMIGERRVMSWICPFYKTWVGMLVRCYSAKAKARSPTYADCTVCREWLSFSVFRSWMLDQEWEGKQLDKDLLGAGIKHYSAATCVFVSGRINTFITDCSASRGKFPIGVCLHKSKGKFMAACKNPFTGKTEYLGLFVCPSAAHEAWRQRKHELACQYADQQTDQRVANALRVRYASPSAYLFI